MVVPVFAQAVRFRPQVTVSFVGLSVLLACAAVTVAGVGAPMGTPPWVHLVAYAALLASLSLAAQYLASADRHSRNEAVIDPSPACSTARRCTCSSPRCAPRRRRWTRTSPW
jgi:hypothetical protein